MTNIEKRLELIDARNKRVEGDKAWETSWTRRCLILILTYMVIAVFFIAAQLPKPFTNAVVPSVAFILSTLTMPLFKNRFILKF